METQLLNASKKNINLACSLLKNGDIVAVRTDTVYGLAGDYKKFQK